MKKFIVLTLLLSVYFMEAQILEPVKWTASVQKISETEYDLVATAKIDSGWHLYSQTVPEEGPIPTKFVFQTNTSYTLIGKTMEEEGITVNDQIFNMKITYFDNKAQFKQRIKLTNKKLTNLVAEVEFMACDDERCLPPAYVDLYFKFK